MSAEPFIAFKLMLKGSERGTFSPMTLFAWLAIGVGVGAMSCLLSVMYGFESALIERVLTAYPHLIVQPEKGTPTLPNYQSTTQRLEAQAEVTRVVPYLEREMIIQSESRTLGAVVWGLPPKNLLELKPKVQGHLPNPQHDGIAQGILGSELAARLGVGTGDIVKLISPIESVGALGLVPRSRSFEVSGIYTSGHYDFDQQYLFLALLEAQTLFKKGDEISGWHVWLDDRDRAEALGPQIQNALPKGWRWESWTTFNAALFHSLKLEQYAMFTILSFAIAIAVLGIVITLIMYVTQKRINIGILRCIGATRQQVYRIFCWQGAFIGAIGLLLGAAITTAFILYVRHFSLFELPEIYYDRSIPIEIRPLSLILIYAIATLMVFLATLYPAKKASEIYPMDALRR